MRTVPSSSDREVIRLLLDAIASSPTAANRYPEAEDFNWQTPTHFGPDGLEALADFCVRTARAIGDELSALFDSPIEFGHAHQTQFYGQDARRYVSESQDYLIPLTQWSREIGMVSLPRGTAVGWVQGLLGGSMKESDDERELSALEADVILDVVDVILRSFNTLFDLGEDDRLERSETVRLGDYKLAADLAKTYCLLRFPPAEEGSRHQFTLLIPCELLERVAGHAKRESASREAGPQEDSRRILHHVRRLPIAIGAELGRTELTLRGLMSLEPGDVLLVDRRTSQPIELLAQDIPVLRGFPVRSEWNYGLRVTEAPENLSSTDPKEPPKKSLPADDSQTGTPALAGRKREVALHG